MSDCPYCTPSSEDPGELCSNHENQLLRIINSQFKFLTNGEVVTSEEYAKMVKEGTVRDLNT